MLVLVRTMTDCLSGMLICFARKLNCQSVVKCPPASVLGWDLKDMWWTSKRDI